MESFRKLGIIQPIVDAIKEAKFIKPSEIQEKAIPLVVAGKDVIAGSATGSGKTLVFGSCIIQHCENRKGIQSLVLVPTRELAEQVARSLRDFSKYKHLHIPAVYGGVGIQPQIKDLHFADVVVGTPGRILDHMQRGTIDLTKVKILVLDEADRMFEMGFIEDVERIISQCPGNRQTLLFSATITEEVSRISRRHMKDPIEVEAEKQVDPSKLVQAYYDTPDNIKFSLLVHLLKHEKAGLVMVFCNTRISVDFVANNLGYNGIKAQAIHGGFSQAKRTSVMDRFHKQEVFVLVCSDVASRGLDIKGVSHVYNYDIPKDSKQYIHRIGRTARAGKEGKAINILAHRDHDNFSAVLRDNHVTITKEQLPQVERAVVKWLPNRRGSGSRFGSRGRFGDNRYGGSRSGNRAGSDERSQSETGNYGKRSKYGDERPQHSSRPIRRFSW
ncbi:DEAD/DEAH box helicase [Candidatus Woesearchaeota archaeon]|nr:DEAD/DEAH box helicase [Candidatus Woesearchaeota archaeon]